MSYDATTIEWVRHRPPDPVLVAVLLYAGAGLAAVVAYLSTRGLDPARAISGALAFGLFGLLAYGLVRGRHVARLVVILLAAVNVLAGFVDVLTGPVVDAVTAASWTFAIGVEIAIVALVIAPRSARRWCERPGQGWRLPRTASPTRRRQEATSPDGGSVSRPNRPAGQQPATAL